MLNIYKHNSIEVALDEVARGCLFGRLYTAAVIWPIDFDNSFYNINDSKKISKKKREELYHIIINNAIDWNVNYIENDEIDNTNILQSNINSMHKNIDKLNLDIDHILVDGNYFIPYKNILHTCIIKGDSKYCNIAAASIIAKVTHDKYITDLCNLYPDLNIKYDLLNNMGYPTKKHIEGIKKYGITKYHRKTFGICNNFN
jgi:ribonuclease HII